MRIKLRAVIPALAVFALAAMPSFGDTIVLGINGDAQVGSNFIYFGNYPIDNTWYAPNTPPLAIFQVSNVPAGSILANAGVVNGDLGNIQSLTSANEPLDTPVNPPVQFMTFMGSSASLWLTELHSGNEPNPPGCVAGGLVVGPFCLQNSGTGSIASFNVDGNVNVGNKLTPYTGTFSATFSGITVQDLVSPGVLPINTPFSATFSLTTATPEPASLMLMGLGLLGAGIVARKKVARS